MIDPATGMIVASGVGAVADIIGGSSARKHARQEAQNQMAFQERMSSTAHQRAVADMEAAGLNPALMYGSGGPASAPAGASAPIENIFDRAGDKLVSSAIESRRLEKELDQLDSQVELNKSLKDQADANASSARSSARATEGYSAIPRKIGEIVDGLPSMKTKTRGLIDKITDWWRNAPRHAKEMERTLPRR